MLATIGYHKDIKFNLEEQIDGKWMASFEDFICPNDGNLLGINSTKRIDEATLDIESTCSVCGRTVNLLCNLFTINNPYHVDLKTVEFKDTLFKPIQKKGLL